MRKYLYTLLLGVITLMLLQGCVKDENDLFELSAAERLNKAVSDYSALLTSSDNGWRMEFFPSSGDMGGYVFTARFSESTVNMAAQLSYTYDGKSYEPGDEYESLYDVIADQGPVLTFNTYNPIFHYFSEPKGSTSVDGFESDYEFIIMSADDNCIQLKGKKYNTKMIMRRLSVSAKEHINEVMSMMEQITGMVRTKMIVNGVTVPIVLDEISLSYETTDANQEISINKTPLIYTPIGFTLYDEIEINGVKLQEFIYEASTSEIKSKENTAVIPVPTLLEQLCKPSVWNFIFDINANTYDMSPAVFEVVKAAYTANRLGWGEYLDGIHLGSNSLDAVPYGLIFDSWDGSRYWYTVYGVNFSPVGDYNDQLDMKRGAEGLNVSSYGKYFGPFVDLILNNAPYRFTADDDKMPTYIKYESVANPDIWFAVEK